MNDPRLFRLVYASRIAPAVEAALESALDDILAASVRNNGAAAISGLLIAHGGWFFQALEGPERAVEARYDVIRRDSRHRDAQRLSWEPAPARLFGRWAMCARRASPTDAAIVQALDGRAAFTPTAGSGPEVLKLLQAVAAIHARALSERQPA